jgi:hypothetical protein
MKSRIEELASSVVSGYTSGATVEQVEVAILTAVNEALELAAKECEKKGKRIGDSDCHWGPEYASRIRKLKV